LCLAFYDRAEGTASMTVDLLLHREAIPGRGAPTWWTGCPQVPGFSACFNMIEETVAASREVPAVAKRAERRQAPEKCTGLRW